MYRWRVKLLFVAFCGLNSDGLVGLFIPNILFSESYNIRSSKTSKYLFLPNDNYQSLQQEEFIIIYNFEFVVVSKMGKFTKDKRVTKNNQYSNHDIYYRKAKEQCYRARSAYKLLQIDDIFHIFRNVDRVVDLCGAPGSWSQVCRKKLGERGLFNIKNQQSQGERIVSVDLQETAPIDNVHHIVGDITKGETLAKILESFKGQLCDLVICDGAPDITGFHDMDQYIQSQLLVAALNITVKVLKKGGNFVAKIFKGSEISFLYSQFKLYFRQIHIFKPNSSRESSAEHFLVGLNYHKDEALEKVELSTFFREIDVNSMNHDQQKIFKFVTCGDLSGFDPIEELEQQEK